MKPFIFHPAIAMLLLTGSLLGANTARADQASDDAALASAVKTALTAAPALSGLNLTVSSAKGDVRIEGEMNDPTQMFEAGVIAGEVPGVKNVVNDMRLK